MLLESTNIYDWNGTLGTRPTFFRKNFQNKFLLNYFHLFCVIVKILLKLCLISKKHKCTAQTGHPDFDLHKFKKMTWDGWIKRNREKFVIPKCWMSSQIHIWEDMLSLHRTFLIFSPEEIHWFNPGYNLPSSLISH